MNIPVELKELLASPKQIVVTSHHNPDGDAIGSALAMYRYLMQKGHRVSVMVPNAFPDFLAWMPGAGQIMLYESDRSQCERLLESAEIIFCLDYNAIPRAGALSNTILSARADKVMIDHHPDPVEGHFDYIISLMDTSSTAELIYDFIVEMGDSEHVSLDIATALYVGIMTDTGSFSYSCNYEKTYHVVAELIRCGVDASQIHRLVYDTFSETRLRLLGFCLSQKLVVLPEYATAYISLSRDELQKYQYRVGDTEGVVNYALSIKGIVLAAMMTEREDKIRLSFRSKGNFSVNELAREHFSGGGHRNAAGGDSYSSLDETINAFVALLPGYRDELLKYS